MRRCLVICPDKAVADQLDEQIAELRHVTIARRLENYPSPLDTTQLLRSHAPQVIFLSVDSLSSALVVIRSVESHAPSVQFVAMGTESDPETLVALMQAGIREFLPSPFSTQDLEAALVRITGYWLRARLESNARTNCSHFCPPKAASAQPR
jgi:DNA-binding NarL/FixJ family response regulator